MTNAPRRVGCVLATVVLAFGGLALFARSSATAAVGTASCSPKTSSGGCYAPGEFCPTADHDTKGTTSDGEAIVCQNKNGWRWEPVAAANSQSSTATTVEGAASTTIAPEGATPTTVPASVATPTTAPVAVATPTTVAAAPTAAAIRILRIAQYGSRARHVLGSSHRWSDAHHRHYRKATSSRPLSLKLEHPQRLPHHVVGLPVDLPPNDPLAMGHWTLLGRLVMAEV